MMLVLLLCVIMKIAELSVGRRSPSLSLPSRHPPTYCNKQKRRYRTHGRNIANEKCKYRDSRTGIRVTMMEDPQTPGSDCNSNPADPSSQDLIGSEFIQDNSEYQWFLDYGYRDGGLHVHPSVLSSLSTSYTHDDLGYYDDLARNLDANLAEVDMESFRTADIHTLLTALPVMCTDPVQQSEGEDSACSTTDTISICKSSLLFSPVKETPVLPPGGSYSVDSLDCEDMLLTCQANNKNNYTIAFEGSMTMYSDGSQDFENQDKQKTYDAREAYYRKMDLKNILDYSMACSDSKIYTTWSNLKHSSTKAMTRHGSGNNNTMPNFPQATATVLLNPNKKSLSLPDLRRTSGLEPINVPLNFSMDSAESHHQQSYGSVAMSRSVNDSTNSNPGGKKLQNMSLVKLFMKQKSMSAEGMSLTLDQSDSASDNGWPTSGSESATNPTTQIQRHNINDACKEPIPENDFAINWVKTDCYKSAGTSSHDASSNNTSKRIPSIKEFKEESPSVEELSESLMKSDFDRLEEACGIINNLKKSNGQSELEKTPISKTTGVQAMTEVEENGVQTSLLYALPPKDHFQYFKETFIEKKPIYVVYPNYTLPDLSFLSANDGKLENVALKPQERVSMSKTGRSNRPFSCNDIDALKQRGFSHVKDWESLTFLLPSEYRKVLHDVPEVPSHIKLGEETKKPLFCLSPPMRQRARTVCEVMPTNVSSSSSTGTQPSSGYRGSSTILTDSSTNPQAAANPLYLYRYDSGSSENSLTSQDRKLQRVGTHVRTGQFPKRSTSLPHGEKESGDCARVPPRPPLPRSILRKNKTASKRYSMFEMGGVEEVEDRQITEPSKRMSLQEPYYMNNDLQLLRHGRIIDSDKDVDEVEERRYAERMKEVGNYGIPEDTGLESSGDDVKQLEEFLRRSGFSSHSSDDGEDPDIKLRSYVRRFLALKMNRDIKGAEMLESQKKTVSFAVQQQKLIEEKADLGGGELDRKSVNLEDKKRMTSFVSRAADALLKFWHPHDGKSRDDKNECAQICLSHLCPALYAIMSDGLKPHLNSTFGPISNSVWQVVEASAQQSPLTNTLNELVQKINSEDVMTEGMLKFHAFVFGLLNLRALDAWFTYLCTRESILRKHYNNSSLFVMALGCVNAREIVDNFLSTLQTLAFCPFQLDLLYQYRQLHNSFSHANSLRSPEVAKPHFETSAIASPKKVRPRSCTYDDKRGTEVADSVKKRWSNLPTGSKIYSVLDKFTGDDSEEYTDSLEHSPLNRASNRKNIAARTSSPDGKSVVDDDDSIPADVKFRKLQEKWEMTCKDEAKDLAHVTSPNQVSAIKSKIPRLLTSPIKQPSGAAKMAMKSPTGIPGIKKSSTTSAMKLLPKKSDSKAKEPSRRTSRVDQEYVTNPRTHLTRPSSLPYKAPGLAAREKNLISPQRRAASTSIPRPNTPAASKANMQLKRQLKEVKTLTHRLPADNGHLAFNEGDRLKVILEVDSKWLLCAKGDRKGLVPRASVHPCQT